MQEKDLPAVMALSYLGDAVHSLYIRRHLVSLGISHAGELNRLSLGYVTAEKQAILAGLLLPLLNETETSVYRRAFNHKGLSRPSHASYAEYRAATGFEAVIGALHFANEQERLAYLLDTVHETFFQNEIQAKDETEK